MYESSCSYHGALELKRGYSTSCPLGINTLKHSSAADWPAYRFYNPRDVNYCRMNAGSLGAQGQASYESAWLYSGRRIQNQMKRRTRERSPDYHNHPSPGPGAALDLDVNGLAVVRDDLINVYILYL